MTLHVLDQTFADADYAQAAAAATTARARLIRRWNLLASLGGGEQQEDVAVAYPCVGEDETHLWVESPIGLIGIPHVRREHHATPGGCPVATVTLRICDRHGAPGEPAYVQVSHVSYDNGDHSSYSGTVLALDQLARREVRS